ncbi:MAG: hypothetical protein MZU97_00915 [Bacillus subtilis]|nr:hypothetical protein [Bacillus subtilis]
MKDGVDRFFACLNEYFTEEHAGLFVQKTNVFGIIEDLTGIADHRPR